jgi:hypothetical protein
MNDTLTRICSIPELAPAERLQLFKELEHIGSILQRIDRGAGFCEDRGFGWTWEMEKAEGTDGLFEKLRAWPILRRLLPNLRHLRHEPKPVIGYSHVPHDDISTAKSLVCNDKSFTGRFGEGWNERTINVTLETHAIRVCERTVASDVGDRPFDFSESAFDYSEAGSERFRQAISKKLDGETCRGVIALAAKMNVAIVPCDLCGHTSQALQLNGLSLVCDSPFSEPSRDPITLETLAILRDALAAQDLPAIRRLKKEWTEGYCEKCDASYCKKHLERWQEGPEYLRVEPYARCPHGHCWEL